MAIAPKLDNSNESAGIGLDGSSEMEPASLSGWIMKLLNKCNLVINKKMDESQIKILRMLSSNDPQGADDQEFGEGMTNINLYRRANQHH